MEGRGEGGRWHFSFRGNVHDTEAQEATDNALHLLGEIGIPEHDDREKGVEEVDEDVGDHPEVAYVGAHLGAHVVGDAAGVAGADTRREDEHDTGPDGNHSDREAKDDAVPGGDGQAVEHGADGNFDDARGQVDAELVGPVELLRWKRQPLFLPFRVALDGGAQPKWPVYYLPCS